MLLRIRKLLARGAVELKRLERRSRGNAQKGLAHVKRRIAWQNQIDHRIGGYGRGIRAGKTVHNVGDDGEPLRRVVKKGQHFLTENSQKTPRATKRLLSAAIIILQ